jgi:hypothetical protein
VPTGYPSGIGYPTDETDPRQEGVPEEAGRGRQSLKGVVGVTDYRSLGVEIKRGAWAMSPESYWSSSMKFGWGGATRDQVEAGLGGAIKARTPRLGRAG